MTRITKNILCCAVFLVQSFQPHAQQVSYTVLEKDPDKYKRTVLYLDLINFDTYNDFSAGYGAKLETFVGDRIMPFVYLKKSWIDAATTHAVSGYPVAVGGLEKQSINEYGGAFFFSVKNKSRGIGVTLRSSSSRSGGYIYTHTKSVSVPGEVKRMFGVRGSLFAHSKVLQLNEESHKRYRYKSADGLIDVPINNVGVFTSVQPAGEAYKPLPMMQATSLCMGLQLRKVTNIKLKVSGYGKRANAKVVDFYADIMYGLSTSISNVKDIAGKEWQIVPQANAIRKMGWRTGFAIHASKTWNILYSFEFGKRPGAIVGDNFLSNGTYLLTTAGMTFGSAKYLTLKHRAKEKTQPEGVKDAQ